MFSKYKCDLSGCAFGYTEMWTPTKESMLLFKPFVSVCVTVSVCECYCWVCCSGLEILPIGVCVFGVCDLEMLCEVCVGHSALDTAPMGVSREAGQILS